MMPTRAKDWFHGVLGAKEAESRLRLEENKPGLYLVRVTPLHERYILSFLNKDLKVKHFKVPGIRDTVGRQCQVSKLFKFKDVREAVNFTVSRLGWDTMSPLNPPSETKDSNYQSFLQTTQCYICETTEIGRAHV